jgi:hypothetical protein
LPMMLWIIHCQDMTKSSMIQPRNRIRKNFAQLLFVSSGMYLVVLQHRNIHKLTTTTTLDGVQVKADTQRRDSGNVLTSGDPPMERSFSNLELFFSSFPGDHELKDDDTINGFTELRETFIRSLQFFWPRDYILELRLSWTTRRTRTIKNVKDWFHGSNRCSRMTL